MMTLRQMKLNACYVNVLENNKWVKTQSNLLKPGDIIEIESSSSVRPYEDIHS
jgi:magnesium-transporting ATPase (P-type)